MNDSRIRQFDRNMAYVSYVYSGYFSTGKGVSMHSILVLVYHNGILSLHGPDGLVSESLIELTSVKVAPIRNGFKLRMNGVKRWLYMAKNGGYGRSFTGYPEGPSGYQIRVMNELTQLPSVAFMDDDLEAWHKVFMATNEVNTLPRTLNQSRSARIFYWSSIPVFLMICIISIAIALALNDPSRH